MNRQVQQTRKGRRPKRRRGRGLIRTLIVFGLLFIGYRVLSPHDRANASSTTTTHHATPSTAPNVTKGATQSGLHSVPQQVEAKPPSLAPLTGVAWPQGGQAAVMIDGQMAGHAGQSTRVPIASLTKMMTALIVLEKYPLAAHETGPTYTVTTQDVKIYDEDYAQNDSAVKVVAGEKLTERQMLEGLLLPSGDNMATMLAGWVSGSESTFVEQMNIKAQQLGMKQTHYADPAGVSTDTVSTAIDQLQVAYAVMQSPVIDEIVQMRSVAFPVVGQIYNTNSDLGHDGIVGLKTGNLTHIGNMSVAADRIYDHKRVRVIAVVLGQRGANDTDSLYAGLAAGKRLIQSIGHSPDNTS